MPNDASTIDLGTMYRFDAEVEDEVGSVDIWVNEYKVVKKTKMGKWILISFFPWPKGKRRFVLDSGKKRFAHETKEDAYKAFMFRKEHQLAILKSQIQSVEHILDYLNRHPFGKVE